MVETKKSISGAEMMLRSLGMGEILDTAKALASDGTFQKIIEFAKQAEEFQKTLKEVKELLDEIKQERTQFRGAETQPDPGSADGIAIGIAGELLPTMLRCHGDFGPSTSDVTSLEPIDHGVQASLGTD